MSNISLIPVLKNIDFVKRYQNICSKFDDLNNSMRGNQKELYDKVLEKLGYKAKYFSKEQFYRIVTRFDDYEFGLQLVLKDGIVESMIDVKKGKTYLAPDGRLDFIPKKMDVEFDRKRYNLPKYTSQKDLEDILKEVFSIYEDIKKAINEEAQFKDKGTQA